MFRLNIGIAAPVVLIMAAVTAKAMMQSKNRVLTERVGEYSSSGRSVLGQALRHGSTDKLWPSPVHDPHASDGQDAFRKRMVSLLTTQSTACTCMINQYIGIDRWLSIRVWKLRNIDVLSNF